MIYTARAMRVRGSIRINGTLRGERCSRSYAHRLQIGLSRSARTIILAKNLDGETPSHLSNPQAMANATPLKRTFHDVQEEEYLKFMRLVGPGDVTRCFYEDITCFICSKVFHTDGCFKRHLDKYHHLPLKMYLELDPKYTETSHKFLCFLCAAVVKATVAEGGRRGHIEGHHGTTHFTFNRMTRYHEQDILMAIARKRVFPTKQKTPRA